MKANRIALTVLAVAAAVLVGCSPGDAGSAYVAKFSAADEDFVDFGAMPSFMNGGSWAILEKVKIPAGATVGWHMFRGRGWENLEGDVAMLLRNDVDTGQVYCLVQQGDWQAVQMDKDDVPGLQILDDTWYTICLQYDAVSQDLELYVNGNFIMELTFIAPIDDSANDNRLFWGGQDVDPAWGQGDLYTEADCVIAHQAWVQRTLTLEEIAAYDGDFDTTDPDLYFATEITATGVIKSGGSGGADGANGNSPEFVLEAM